MQTTYDPQAVAMVRAIKMQESGNDYNTPPEKAGTSLGGAYQYQAPTWKAYAGQILGDSNASFTKENQDKVTYGMVKQWKDSGMQPSEIAHMWNPGDSKYPNEVVDHLKKIAQKSVSSNQATLNPDTDLTKDTIVPNTAKSEQKNNSSVALRAAGNVTGVEKLAEGAGISIANSIFGTQEKAEKGEQNIIDTQTKLVQAIKEARNQGKDTAHLEEALKNSISDVGNAVQTVTDVGTGGLKNSDILKSAAQTALTIATAPSLIKGGIGLFKGADVLEAPVVKNILKGRTLSAGDKLGLLTGSLQDASTADKLVLQQAISKLEPLAIQEAGGEVPFAKLYPKVAKTLRVLRNAGGIGLGLAGLDKVGSTVKGLLK